MPEAKLYKKENLLEELKSIGDKLPRPITVYLIGGCAMSLRDLKQYTKDVDAIFTSLGDLGIFENGLMNLGYERTLKTEAAYEQLGASSILRHSERAGFDLFHMKVCNMLILSEDMKKRASKYADLGKLTVCLLSNEDIALFKGITHRPRDIEDMALLIRGKYEFDWNAIKTECKSQAEYLKVEGHLYNRLLELFEKYQIRAPILSWLKNRDKRHILKDVYEHRLEEGSTREQILEQFTKDGFSKSDLKILKSFGTK